MTRRLFLLVAVLSLLPAFTLNATSIFDLLQQSATGTKDAVPVVIKLPLDSIYAKTDNEQLAFLSFTDHTGLAQRWPLHVDVRGKFRRRICTFPPLKLNFSKKELKSKGLDKYDKFKLVTPCYDDEDGQNLVLREYLTYKLLNEITPASFRVQLLEITYKDINGTHPDETRFAFILEDNDEMAARLKGERMKEGFGLSPEEIDRAAEATQAVFSYFIGNTDWSVATSHNLKMVTVAGGKTIPVPYDFDFAAIVDAPYARPNNSVGQTSLKERVYLGFSASDEQLDAAIAPFVDKRKTLMKMVRQFSLLPLEERYAMVEYLTGFYSDVKQIKKGKGDEVAKTFYGRLRGKQTDLVPAGAMPEYYGVGKK